MVGTARQTESSDSVLSCINPFFVCFFVQCMRNPHVHALTSQPFLCSAPSAFAFPPVSTHLGPLGCSLAQSFWTVVVRGLMLKKLMQTKNRIVSLTPTTIFKNKGGRNRDVEEDEKEDKKEEGTAEEAKMAEGPWGLLSPALSSSPLKKTITH